VLTRIVCLLVLIPAFILGQDKPELKVDQIVQNHVDALGGIENIRAIHTFSASGTAKMMGGQVQAPMLMQMKRPSSMRIEMSIQEKRIVQAFDGTTAWMINTATGSEAPKLASPEETQEMKNSADIDFSSLVDYRAKGNTVELVGTEVVEGRSAYKLKVTKQNGRVEYDYLDTKTFLPLKTTAKRKQMGTEVDIDAYPSQFRPVAGVLFPFEVDQKANGKTTLVLTMEKVDVNMPLDDAVFRMPELPTEKANAGKKFLTK
jgi:hypothetical protein